MAGSLTSEYDDTDDACVLVTTVTRERGKEGLIGITVGTRQAVI